MWQKWLSVCVLLFVTCSVAAEGVLLDDIGDAFHDGSPEVAFRLRYENAKQAGLLDANAVTLRSTVGYETAAVYNSTIKVELVDVANMFGQHYNPGVSELSAPQYSLINDPRGAGLTEGKIIFSGIPQNAVILGRQYIQLNNERFVGKNDYRQYPQSFDALSLQSNMFNDTEIFVSYVTYVNTNTANGRGVGGRRSLSTTLLNVMYNASIGKFTGYLYINRDHSIATNSNTSMGVRFAETSSNRWLHIEFAKQYSCGNNPENYNTSYLAYSDYGKSEWLLYGLGLEFLGGSKVPNHAFITPLASVDNFSGLAEVFTTTPVQGLLDLYGSIGVEYELLTGMITYHWFSKAKGIAAYGQELDITAQIKLNKKVCFEAGFAKYYQINHSANLPPTTCRVWFMLIANML